MLSLTQRSLLTRKEAKSQKNWNQLAFNSSESNQQNRNNLKIFDLARFFNKSKTNDESKRFTLKKQSLHQSLIKIKNSNSQNISSFKVKQKSQQSQKNEIKIIEGSSTPKKSFLVFCEYLSKNDTIHSQKNNLSYKTVTKRRKYSIDKSIHKKQVLGEKMIEGKRLLSAKNPEKRISNRQLKIQIMQNCQELIEKHNQNKQSHQVNDNSPMLNTKYKQRKTLGEECRIRYKHTSRFSYRPWSPSHFEKQENQIFGDIINDKFKNGEK